MRGKQILQKLIVMGIDWDDKIPKVVSEEWCTWVKFMRDYSEFSIPRYCFTNGHDYETNDKIVYKFCDASNSALSCVVYLRRIVNEHEQVCVSFV